MTIAATTSSAIACSASGVANMISSRVTGTVTLAFFRVSVTLSVTCCSAFLAVASPIHPPVTPVAIRGTCSVPVGFGTIRGPDWRTTEVGRSAAMTSFATVVCTISTAPPVVSEVSDLVANALATSLPSPHRALAYSIARAGSFLPL